MKFYLTFSALMLLAGPAFAADAIPAPTPTPAAVDAPAPRPLPQPAMPGATGDQPLTIKANRTLEWHRNDHEYVATGGAVATQGTSEIVADKLIARYREGAEKKAGSPSIYELEAIGNVVITSDAVNKAYGDHAIYHLDTKQAVLTGNDLRLETPDHVVTAHERFEYWTAEGRVVAVGDAVVATPTNKIAAQTITAWMGDDTNGKRSLVRATADGHVTITTPTEVATGSSGEYVRATDIATLQGPVKITRGPNVLNGDRAEVNMTTNLSTLFANTAKGGRVTGVFYPDAGKKK